MPSHLAWVPLLSALALVACGSEVLVQPEKPCEAPGDGGHTAVNGPPKEPAPGTRCTEDFLKCSYGPAECEAVYSCEPVYPEAGAPSEWIQTDWVDCSSCPAERPVLGTSCALPEAARCGYDAGGCYEELACVGERWEFVFGECPCPQPACDPGDTPVESCPLDAPCYEAVSPCGMTILCLDQLPEHGCPPAPPPEGASCSEPDQTCTYPDGNCFTFYMCEGASLTWFFAGGGCDT